MKELIFLSSPFISSAVFKPYFSISMYNFVVSSHMWERWSYNHHEPSIMKDILFTMCHFIGCRTDILILFLNQDPNLLRSYVIRPEGISLMGLLVWLSQNVLCLFFFYQTEARLFLSELAFCVGNLSLIFPCKSKR